MQSGLLGNIVSFSLWSLSIAATASFKNKTILVVMPSESFLRLDGGNQVRVGSYLDEFAIPAGQLLDAGYSLVIATPQGNKPVLDPSSNTSSSFPNEQSYEDALLLWNTLPSLQLPILLGSLSQENADNPVDAVDIIGGHAPIIDLMSSSALGRILYYFVNNSLPIGSLCHGPVSFASLSLMSTSTSDSASIPWPLIGRKMTVFSDNEEKVNEASWGSKLGFYPQDLLINLGGVVSVAAIPFFSHVVVDGNLVTGQNPQSATDFGIAFVKLLESSTSL